MQFLRGDAAQPYGW